jgi:hypothetical protein
MNNEFQNVAYAHLALTFYLQTAFRKHFRGIYIHKKSNLSKTNSSFILAPNHFSWWDGFFAYELNRVFYKKNFWVAMLERELSKNPFLKKIGATSITQGNIKETLLQLERYRDQIENSDNLCLVWFSQGELQNLSSYPIKLKKGINYVAQNTKVIPAYFHIEFGKHPKPHVCLITGEEIDKTAKDKKKLITDSINELKNIVENDLIKQSMWKKLLGKDFDLF